MSYMSTTTLENVYEQRKAVKQELNQEIAKAKELITNLIPDGSYEDYQTVKRQYEEIDLIWALIRMRLATSVFNFDGQIRRLRKDPSLIYGNHFADELDKAEPRDVHGFFRRIEELGNDLRTKKNVYTQFPEIRESLNKIARLSADECALKIQANSSYGNQTHAFSKQLFRTQ